MRWCPDRIWEGCEVFIIGGGKSLDGWDFGNLIGEKTIGCNDAYIHGPKICNICIFGDRKFLRAHENGLANFAKSGGLVVTNERHLEISTLSWLNWMPRQNKGLHTDALGWNTNTGASAINLALILGAGTVFLLGFDRHRTKGETNWHPNKLDKYTPELYQRMNASDGYMKKDLNIKFPGCEVINVTDGSDLPHWPKVSFTQFWNERKSHVDANRNSS